MRWFGWLCGFVLANLVLALLPGDQGFLVGVAMGFALTGLGYLIGLGAER